MTPLRQDQYVDDPRFPGKFNMVSKFRGSRTLFIYKPYEEIFPVNYKLTLKSNVGFKLFGKSESICDFLFTKNVYYPGEKVAVAIDCDNGKCSNDIKAYKLKLYRTVRFRNAISGHFEDNLSLVSEM